MGPGQVYKQLKQTKPHSHHASKLIKIKEKLCKHSRKKHPSNTYFVKCSGKGEQIQTPTYWSQGSLLSVLFQEIKDGD